MSYKYEPLRSTVTPNMLNRRFREIGEDLKTLKKELEDLKKENRELKSQLVGKTSKKLTKEPAKKASGFK